MNACPLFLNALAYPSAWTDCSYIVSPSLYEEWSMLTVGAEEQWSAPWRLPHTFERLVLTVPAWHSRMITKLLIHHHAHREREAFLALHHQAPFSGLPPPSSLEAFPVEAGAMHCLEHEPKEASLTGSLPFPFFHPQVDYILGQTRVPIWSDRCSHFHLIFHQPRFPWNKGISLPQLPFGGPGRVFGRYWPDKWISLGWNFHPRNRFGVLFHPTVGPTF